MDAAELIERALTAGRDATPSALQAGVLAQCLGAPEAGVVIVEGLSVRDTSNGLFLSGQSKAALLRGGGAVVVATHAGERLTVFEIGRNAPGVSVSAIETLDGLSGAELSIDHMQAAVARILPVAALAPAYLALAGELTGAAEAAFNIALDRAKQRKQFGRAIGSFQALGHLLVNAFVDLEAMQLALREAVAGPVTLADAMALKALCATNARRVTATAQQVHGGEGYYADLPLHAFTRRAAGLALRLGTPARLYASLARHDATSLDRDRS